MRTPILTTSRVISRGSVALIAGTGVGLTAGEYAGSDSGAVRSFRFWKGMVPIYAHYKLVEWRLRNETDAKKISAAYHPLNEKYSPRVQKLALDLKGFYFKLAQIMSTRDDFLPDEYLKWTKELQDKSPAVISSEEVREIVERSLGLRADDYFSEWDDEPIGAASVGQVHRARLAGDGTEVAVKVQFPGIEDKFRNDIDTVELFCKFLMPQNTAYFAEIKRQFATEFDMRGEAENLREVHDNLHRAGWNRLVEVPYPITSSKEVLIMTYLHGRKLVDGVREQFSKLAARRGVSVDDLERDQKRRMEEGTLQRVEIGDAAAATRRMRWLLAGRNAVVNLMLIVWNYTVGPIFGRSSVEYWDSSSLVNLGEVMNTLIRVHGHEVFVDGAFNGDPHPGNILLMEDGRLGLIDYGQVKRMKVADRITYAKMIISLSRNDQAEVVRLARDDTGFRTKNRNNDVTYRSLAFFHCRDSDDILQGMNVSEFMEWMEKTDPVEQINDEFVMVGRVSLLLRGMANAFGMKVRISDYWRDEAETFLKSRGIEY